MCGANVRDLSAVNGERGFPKGFNLRQAMVFEKQKALQALQSTRSERAHYREIWKVQKKERESSSFLKPTTALNGSEN